MTVCWVSCIFRSGHVENQCVNMLLTFAATFEDKRKENFDKGQAELERRRALLREQMKAEENTRLEKERREAEKLSLIHI